jgi:hypothetical protein
MPAERGRVEPAPRRVRGYVDGVLVFDTVAARYVWEVPYYPQYYVPVKDVRTQYLVDENHPRRLQFGTARSHALHVNGVTVAEAVRVFGDDALPGLAEHGALRVGRRGVVRGGRADRRRAPAQAPTRGSTRCGRTGTCGWRSTAWCWPRPGPRCCCSRPGCPRGTTSTAPTSRSSTSSRPTPRRPARTRG